MKLVTGIEAIQSGKPWKHQIYNHWVTDNTKASHLTLGDLLKKEFIIKEEPREFWIFINSIGEMCAYMGTYKGADTSGDNWIRVREIEK